MIVGIWVQCAIFDLAHTFFQGTFLVGGFGDFFLELDYSWERFGIIHFLSFVAILVVLILVVVSWIIWRILFVHTLKDV